MDAQWYTPAVTVFDQNRQLDLAGCSRVYRNLIDNGIDGILVLGSLGEFFTLTLAERKAVIDNAVKTVAGRIPVIAGTSSLIIDECIELSNYALEQGVDAVMVIPPYYFNLPDSAIVNFYDSLALQIKGLIYLYNYPAVTGYDLKPEVIEELALKHDNIIGIKDTVPNMDHTRAIIQKLRSKRPGFRVFSGFDENFGHNLLSGGCGCIASTSNFAPEVAAAYVAAARADNLVAMTECQKAIDDLMPIYSIAGQFTPIIKKAMVLRGIIDCDLCREPLLPASDTETEKIQRLLKL